MDVKAVCLLMVLAFSSSRGEATEKSCTCGEVIELTCVASAEPGVNYRTVRWYKIDEDNKLYGLARKRLAPHNNTVEYYKDVIRNVEFASENSSNLILPNVTAKDHGKYICFLAAPLGHRNQEGEVLLTVDGCPEVNSIDFRSLELFIAIAVLLFSLLIFTMSYIFLRNVLKSSKKKLIKENLWKISHQEGNIVYVLGKNGLKALDSVYV
ncbi:hypothetical protein ACEWY4_020033 [Coilia grayii]|uniref:Ig-like domain-containing protein n=1 Tax=Coilia grayii TaxID=363190 RepID=A0ABD1JBG2_9TELE